MSGSEELPIKDPTFSGLCEITPVGLCASGMCPKQQSKKTQGTQAMSPFFI